MKKVILIIGLLVFLSSAILRAQPTGGGPGGGGPPGGAIPIDGGIAILVAAGAFLGARKIFNKQKK